MKRVLMVLLSISFGLILLGFSLAAAGGFKIANLPEGKDASSYGRLASAVVGEKSIPEKELKSIHLEIVNSDLEVFPCSGSDVRLSYESLYKNEWQYSFDGSQMKLVNMKYKNALTGLKNFSGFLKELREGKFNMLFKINNGNDSDDELIHHLRLYIPNGSSQKIYISGVNGSVSMKDTAPDSLELSLVNCGFNSSGVVSKGEVKIGEVNGKVELDALKASDLELSSFVNGSCEMASPQIDSIRAENFVNGNMRITGVSDPNEYSVNYEVVNGKVTIGESSFENSGNISGGKYDVRFNGVNSSLTISK